MTHDTPQPDTAPPPVPHSGSARDRWPTLCAYMDVFACLTVAIILGRFAWWCLTN